MNLPAPHEKWMFSHYSTSQEEIKEEVRRTFQTINAKQANLTTDKNDIINVLNKGNDTAPLDELTRWKSRIPRHDWDECNKKLFELKELENALFKHMNCGSSPGPDGFTVNWLRVFWPELKHSYYRNTLMLAAF